VSLRQGGGGTGAGSENCCRQRNKMLPDSKASGGSSEGLEKSPLLLELREPVRDKAGVIGGDSPWTLL
jgi:hypothetical protein